MKPYTGVNPSMFFGAVVLFVLGAGWGGFLMALAKRRELRILRRTLVIWQEAVKAWRTLAIHRGKNAERVARPFYIERN